MDKKNMKSKKNQKSKNINNKKSKNTKTDIRIKKTKNKINNNQFNSSQKSYNDITSDTINSNINSKQETHDNNIINLNKDFNSKNLICTKKLQYIFLCVLIIFILLLVRLGYLQFIDSDHLKELAYQQQAINQILSPKRGNIYDSTGKALAISAQVDTITINPAKISGKTDEETKAKKELVAKGLSDIFDLNYDETLEKVNSKSSVETIAKKVEKDKVEELRTWMKDNKISVGINIDEDTKRYYPYNNLASSVIGFCGADNQGLSGIEAKWDNILKGTPGKIVSYKASDQNEIPNTEETYISAENGSDITLTIDLNIQSIVEKYLKQAVEKYDCANGGNVIVMDPKTGNILGMANYPDYNLNTPYTPNSVLAKTYDSLSDEEKNEALYRMWANKSVSDSYEPGSTFKIITSSVALEENITTPNKPNDFYCQGYEVVEDRTIKCWRKYDPHGSQTLTQALENSCNPAFMQLASRIGAPTLYKYYQAFGLFDSTNSGLYGEQTSIFHDLEKVGPVELATYSFGQRFQVTPLQLITAISSIANDGVLMKPNIVKSIKNTDTGAITNTEPTEVRQVLSKSTTDKVKSMMESVVLHGTGKNVAVSGYSIGGKSGTSEPVEGNEDSGYVSSFVAISPIEDTQVVVLLTLYNPQNKKYGYQGGSVAAPVVSQMLSEILPYMGVPSDNTNTDNSSQNLITVPDITNKTITEAKKILTNAGFTCKISSSGDENSTLVTNQTPKPGVSLQKNSIIMLYGEGHTVENSVSVPDLSGMTVSQATSILRSKNLNISYYGSGIITTQDYAVNELVPEGTVINVNLKPVLTDAH